MALATGTRLGAFEILGLVGAGGMGEVYRARDTRLDRTVAIKILHDDGIDAAFPRRLERFRQEARAVARITHPNICTLHDVCQEGDTTFLVMEFVEGTTLAQRLERGALPLAEALRIGVQVADALDHAHHQAVVHRDLKPSNIMLARDRVKLLDFGLAKLMEPDERDVVGVATATHLTDARTIVGTAAYMAPEQIEGGNVDARTDIFALGVVLYEMLAGRRPFTGDGRISTMASVVGATPQPLRAIVPDMPPAVERLVHRCLAKDREDRWQTARDLAAELRWMADGRDAATEATPKRRVRWYVVLAWAASIALAVAAGAVLVRLRNSPPPPPAILRFSVPPPGGESIASPGVFGSPVAVSPDGRHIAFLAAGADGVRHLYLRRLDDVRSRRLPGTQGAMEPFWSADSRSIGFFAADKLQRISIDASQPQVICDARTWAGGATWNRDDVILFSPFINETAIYRVSANGGTPTPVTVLDPGLQDIAHIWPSFLPDGRHFLFQRFAGRQSGIYVQALAGGAPKLLLATPAAIPIVNMPVFASPGYLLFTRIGGDRHALMAQRFDPQRLEVAGEAFQVAERVDVRGPAASFSVSQTGLLAYWEGETRTRQLQWVDRTGASRGIVSAPGSYGHVALSPDGERVALVGTGRTDGIWVLDLDRGTTARLTLEGYAVSPVWSPDGGALVFSAARETPPNLFLQRVGAPGDPERLTRTRGQHFASHWSADGRSVVFVSVDPATRRDLWRIDVSGNRQATAIVQTAADESHGRISPDGRWLAYDSDESGRMEVYVTTYPLPGRRWLVSVNGGRNAVWRHDGRELYYASADNRLMAVPVRTAPAFDPGVPQALFALNAAHIEGWGFGWSYDVARDGRFLVNTDVDRSSPPLTVVVNWLAESAKR